MISIQVPDASRPLHPRTPGRSARVHSSRSSSPPIAAPGSAWYSNSCGWNRSHTAQQGRPAAASAAAGEPPSATTASAAAVRRRSETPVINAQTDASTAPDASTSAGHDGSPGTPNATSASAASVTVTAPGLARPDRSGQGTVVILENSSRSALTCERPITSFGS